MNASEAAFGRYEIRAELGWGGFSTVYRAWDPALRREVALKALLPHLARDPDFRRRFLAEAQALARLQHLNIVPVYDVGGSDDRPFFAMALVEGQTFAQLLADRQRLPLSEAIELLRSLAMAIDELHRHGLIHRDVKPQNVMLDRAGNVVLMDLGIARDTEAATMTGTGSTLGTAAYMSPEQAAGQRAGFATDIYALGILAYHLLAGRPPFTGDLSSVIHAQVYEAPPPLRDKEPGLPDAVYDAVDSALAKDPARRPQSAAAFLERLTARRAPIAAPALDEQRTEPFATPVRSGSTVELPAAPDDAGAGPPPKHRRGLRGPVAIAGAVAAAIVIVGAGGISAIRLTSGNATSGAAINAASASVPAAPGSGFTPGAATGRATTGGAATARPPAEPSQDCAPARVAVGQKTACSIFLDSDVVRGTKIVVALTSPASASIGMCRSPSGGLACGTVSGGSATISCSSEPCRTGAQFTLDITASSAGGLAQTVTITGPAGAVHTFTYRDRATFGP